MKHKLIKVMSLFIGLMLFSQGIFADDTANMDGGGSGLGQGSNDNGWVVTSRNGDNIYNAEGFRVYLVNSSTGVPVSVTIDITNYSITQDSIYNGSGKTKYEYNYVNGSLSNFDTDYRYVRIGGNTAPLPQIIPWNENGNASRIENIKNWFLNARYADWVLFQLGTDIEEVRAGGYLLAIEPIAYFRYLGLDYAMTATEAAIFDETAGGDLRRKLGPLSHKNLPLAIFLETNEFVSSKAQINAWTGSRTTSASNDDIRRQLGIGFVHYIPQEIGVVTMGEADFSYPTDTWVVTAFRLCNVRRNNNSWTNGVSITSMNPATAYINVNGQDYVIRNIYIPSGNEQLVWVKWKTPSTPQELVITASADKGLYYNQRNTDISNRYVNIVTSTVIIYDNDMENEPPDPTLNDTSSSIGYNAAAARVMKNTMMSGGSSSNSWIVWDCNFYLDEHTEEYKYVFNPINYRVEVKTSYINMTPDEHCPTAYTRNYNIYMKSGYGVNVETEPFIRVTIIHGGTGVTTRNDYYSPTATSFAAAPQYVFGYFPEFNYEAYFRQFEYFNNRFVFKHNRFSTYNSRVHYTPWWFSDNAHYEVIVRNDFAYTPAGKLSGYTVSNPIVIEGNLMDDWRIVAVR